MKETADISFVLFPCGWHLQEMGEFQLLLLPGLMKQHLVNFQEIILPEFRSGTLCLPHYPMYIHLKRGMPMYLAQENQTIFMGYVFALSKQNS
jgi:hypothetical protein